MANIRVSIEADGEDRKKLDRAKRRLGIISDEEFAVRAIVDAVANNQ